MSRWRVEIGDSRERLRELADASVDSVVTDPPYELGFMGKSWDASGIAYNVDLWREVLRVLKPGGHLLAFGATRTYHRLAVAIEDAGFEIRDSMHWMYGSGFPKSLDVSKAIDKAAGARGPEGKNMRVDDGAGTASYRATVDPREYVRPPPVTDAAKTWLGWGTALKPSHEPIVVARKPLDGTVAANVQAHGVGGINVDACRIGDEVRINQPTSPKGGGVAYRMSVTGMPADALPRLAVGRWPPNVLFAHRPSCSSEACEPGCAVLELCAQSGKAEAARFFPAFRYQAKPGRRERDEGLHEAGLPATACGSYDGRADGSLAGKPVIRANIHPTVKPVDLMRWCIRLVTAKGGLVLDPFTGSGTTGVAAVLEDARFVGVELSPDYQKIAVARIAAAQAGQAGEQLDLFEFEEDFE